MPPKRTSTTTTTPMTDAQIKALIAQGVADAWVEIEANRTSRIGDDSHDSGTGSRRTERAARECTYSDFLKFQPLNFKGTEGVVSLTQWFEKMEFVFHISNCAVASRSSLLLALFLLALMFSRMFLEESGEVEKYVGGLPDMIQGSVMASKPKTIQDAIEFATELMDQKICSLADRQAKNKRKLDDTSMNNQNQQQPFKRHNVARAYTAGPGEKKMHITAKVAGKSVSISEASIRSDLLFDDDDGIDSLLNQAIFDAIQLMGSKSTSWDQIPTNIATAVICLTSNQKYNFSKLIFDEAFRWVIGVSDSSQRNTTLKAQIKKLKEAAKPVINITAHGCNSSLEAKIGKKEILKETMGTQRSVSKRVDHMETENAQDVRRTREIVDEEKEIDENILSTEDVLSTDKEKVSTDEQIESTDEQRKGTKDHTKEGSATQVTQTPTSTIFGDDETIAKVLLNMSQAKAVSREKEKGVEQRKKKIEEEDESKSESDGIPEAERSFKQLASDEEMARKIQEEWEGKEERNGNFKHSELKTKKFEEIQALYEKIMRSDEDFISIGSAEDERQIKRMNEKGIDSSKSEVIKEESKEEVQGESKEEETLGLLPRLLIQWECLGLPMWPVVMSEVPRWPSRRNSCVERLEFTLSSLLQVKMRGKGE
ncbi:hypothetical protein Tco_0770311 [Tanacetum coccineum]|uniref:Uncharacterized protein n=1 Tax=Tanacetum coccineum TaxID=301880 RepID=A0ABQ4ZC36_9ASTR